jgi:CCR4-NOT transcription complex subunit 1
VAVTPTDSNIATVHGPILKPSTSTSFSTQQFSPFTSASQSKEPISDKTDPGATQLTRYGYLDIPLSPYLSIGAPCSEVLNANFCSLSAPFSTTDSPSQVAGTTNLAAVFPPMASGDLVGELATAAKVSHVF